MGFDLFGGIFDFDGNGSVDETEAFLGTSLFSGVSSRNSGFGVIDDDDDENEDSDDYDPFFAQDYNSAEEFYEDNSGDFTDLEEAADYYSDWG